MNDNHLDKATKKHYSNASLSSEALKNLHQITIEHDTAVEPKNNTKLIKPSKKTFLKNYQMLSMAASFLFVLVFSFQAYQLKSQDIFTRVAQEVALNHSKQLASEFTTDNLIYLASKMNKLDFDLKLPSKPLASKLTLLGARYCSIQGGIAAQIHLQDAQDKKSTLYITKTTDSLAALNNTQYQSKEVLINNWQEGELFFSHAQNK